MIEEVIRGGGGGKGGGGGEGGGGRTRTILTDHHHDDDEDDNDDNEDRRQGGGKRNVVGKSFLQNCRQFCMLQFALLYHPIRAEAVIAHTPYYYYHHYHRHHHSQLGALQMVPFIQPLFEIYPKLPHLLNHPIILK
ncbi:unnamed protein product [Onchocerca flexuosa]|uniref:Uncharacterized protein n=1 Tax=Onchocerca flexuosa TaxID=387005 RepID=A0A183HPS5_9BILA|nr:unnamed protein product [Onchocerca flexuosa]